MTKPILNFFKIIDYSDDLNLFIKTKTTIKFFHRQNQGIITIILPHFLPVAVIQQLEEKMALLKHNIIIEFKVLKKEYDLETINAYFDYIKIYKLKLFAGIISDLPKNAFHLKAEKLIINVHNSTEKKLIEKELSAFLTYFYRYGFVRLKVKVETIASLPKFLNLKTEIIAELKKVNTENISVRANNHSNKAPKNSIKNLIDAADTHKFFDIKTNIDNLIVTGKIVKITKFFTKTQKWFYTFLLTDYQTAINAKVFVTSTRMENLVKNLTENDTIKVFGSARYDSYIKDEVIWINDIIKVAPLLRARVDEAKQKRVEFHVHTKMSAMDGVSSAAAYIDTVARWNHPAIAFTDHLNLQAYPDIFEASKKYPQLKIIYGVEMELVPEIKIAYNSPDLKFNEVEFLIFDLETTGLSVKFHEIIEFGYVIVKAGTILKQDTILLKPNKEVPSHITEITSITNEMLSDKPTLADKIIEISEIVKNRVLVAHNAIFDIGFLAKAYEDFNLGTLNNPIIDTLQLARVLNPELKYYRLGVIARNYGVKYESEIAHRADYDTLILSQIFFKMLTKIEAEKAITKLNDLNSMIDKKINEKIKGQHITVYAKNQEGLKKIYQIVSDSHTNYFYKSPKIMASVFDNNRDNLIIGSACTNGIIFETAMNKSEAELKAKMAWFDFIEIQPPAVYQHLLHKKQITKIQLELILTKIVHCAKALRKIVIASSDAHYVEPYEKVFRSVIINNKAIGGLFHPLYDYKKENFNYPDQHLRTTNEMIEEFSFLNDKNLINEIVIENTQKLALQFAKVEPIKSGLYTPVIDDVNQKLSDLCFNEAKRIYGDKIPEIIQKRLDKELHAIITHGFAVIYWIAHKLVAKSLTDGYLVGSRGSVGSSLVATFANITEVNPLPPHYLCLNCSYSDFTNIIKARCGYDLPDAICPNCHQELKGEGHDIPFETFLGYEGDKKPDIDLNFSGEYQLRAHDFTKEMFGANSVFRAGTISTVASKTAYGFAKNYAEQVNLTANNATIEWLSLGCIGVKRTTGQHPGGIIVVPKEYDINDFTPINFPADDKDSTWKTTHFAFEAIHDNLLKLDILGHVDPTALKMLNDLTNVDPKTIPNKDPKVLSLFSNLKTLNLIKEDLLGEEVGTIGIPEFGTNFVRKMLLTTKPSSFAELVQISGLSHGTDVWLNNAEILINTHKLALKDVIGCRDDIMTYLVYQGIESKIAFNIMEDVRKGKGLKSEYVEVMQKHYVPQWYIDSCKKIKYMFPKAHATAYVLMAWRIAWYKVYYPYEYYATYFSTRCDIFDIKTMLAGKKAIAAKIIDINNRLKDNPTTVNQKEKDLISILEVALEMYSRGIVFTNIDIEKSEAINFKVAAVENKKVIIPPFIALDGLGEINAQSIVKAREKQAIVSLFDLQERTSITKTNFQNLQDLGALDNLIQNAN